MRREESKFTHPNKDIGSRDFLGALDWILRGDPGPNINRPLRDNEMEGAGNWRGGGVQNGMIQSRDNFAVFKIL